MIFLYGVGKYIKCTYCIKWVWNDRIYRYNI